MPPDAQIIANLSPGRLTSQTWEALGPELVNTFMFMLLRCPLGTDIRDSFSSPTLADYVEVPAWSGRLYSVLAVEDIGGGFANEHRCAVIRKTGVWPIPMPSVIGPYFPPPPPPGPPPFVGIFSTGGVPALLLAAPFTLAAAGPVIAWVTWTGAGIAIGSPGQPSGPVFGSVQTNVIGGVTFNSALMAFGPLAAGAYVPNWTVTGIFPQHIQVIYATIPGGLSVTNAVASGVGGGFIDAGFTGLTTVAPADVFGFTLVQNPAGAVTFVPPPVVFGGFLPELCFGVNVISAGCRQWGLGNAIYNFNDMTSVPAGSLWSMLMFK